MAKYKITFIAPSNMNPAPAPEEVEAHSVTHEGEWIKLNDGFGKPIHVYRERAVKRYDMIGEPDEPFIGIV